MQIKEAHWIIDQINLLGDEIFPLLNLGSSNAKFREEVQPYIDEIIFRPLRQAGMPVIHCDIKSDTGVDIVGDLTDSEFVQKLSSLSIRGLLCSNMLEHINHPEVFCQSISEVLPSGGYAIITVPYIYPFHKDPIDTKFRPSIEELTKLFPKFTVVKSEYIVFPEKHFTNLLKNPTSLFLTIKNWIFPRFGIEEWKLRLSDIPNLFKNIQETCLILKKN